MEPFAQDLFNAIKELGIIEEKKPDFICLGYDQKIDARQLAQELVQRGLFPKIKRISPYKARKQKSSLLRERVLKL